jgi:hypothetical protein
MTLAERLIVARAQSLQGLLPLVSSELRFAAEFDAVLSSSFGRARFARRRRNWGTTAIRAVPMRPGRKKRKRTPKLASQIRVAFSSITWNTGSSSPGELLMTRSTQLAEAGVSGFDRRQELAAGREEATISCSVLAAYSITSSARWSNDDGTVRPSTFAAHRLITS